MADSIKWLPDEIAELLVNLVISDQTTRGRPTLLPSEVPQAQNALRWLLVDPDMLSEYVADLARLYQQAKTKIVFTHCALLDSEHAEKLLAQGPDRLPLAVLAELLLSPFALTELAEEIRATGPQWWLDLLDAANEAMEARYAEYLEVGEETVTEEEHEYEFTLMDPRGGTAQPQKGNGLLLGFSDESRQRQREIALALYGNADAVFELALHRRERVGAGFLVEVEVSPAPTVGNLALTIDLKGHPRTFLLEVPLSVKLDPEADPPERVFARCPEPVPEAALLLKGEALWREDGWLILRTRVTPGEEVTVTTENETPTADQVLLGGFVAVMQQEMEFEAWWQMAGTREVAYAATDESVAAIVAFLGQYPEQLGKAALALADGIERHASVLRTLGRNRHSLALCQAIQPIYAEHAEAEMQAELWNHFGIVLRQMGQLPEAVRVYEQAIAILDRLVDEEGRGELANDLAGVLMNKANSLSSLGQLAEAVRVYDQAIAIRDRLVNQEGRGELANDLATALVNKGVPLTNLGQLPEAVRVYEQAIAILDRLVNQEGHGELANDLATALMNKGVALDSLGQLPEAVRVYDQAIAIRERLVNQEGRKELANDLAADRFNMALLLEKQEEWSPALEIYRSIDPGILSGEHQRKYHHSQR